MIISQVSYRTNGPLVKIEAYHPYKQSVVIILSILYDDVVAMVTVQRHI